MSADRFLNELKRQGAQMDATRSHTEPATVLSYNPLNGTMRATYQPSGTPSGWLPCVFPSVGPGTGIVCPPVQGQQVLMAFEGGERDSGVMLGGMYSDLSLIPGINGSPVQSGEIALITGTSSGTFLYLDSLGNITLQTPTSVLITAPSVTITGNVHIAQNLTVGNGATGSVALADGRTMTIQDGIVTNIF